MKITDIIKAIVQKVIPNGEHGPFVVATSETLCGSVTFSLEPTVWKEKEWPEEGTVVILGKLRQKRAGWRAKTGRFWNPSDEQKERSIIMNWRNRVNLINSKMHDLKSQAKEILNTDDLDKIEMWSKQAPFETYLQKKKTNLKVLAIETKGTPCLILSSILYPKFGILIFDASGIGGASEIALELHDGIDPRFSIVCGCCIPQSAGIERIDIGKANFESFAMNIRQACKNNGITHLYFHCYKSVLKQDIDGLTLNDDLSKLEKWQFAAAFKEIRIGDDSFPFDKLFDKK